MIEKMISNKVWLPPQEPSTIPEDALVVKGKLLISEKNWELPVALHECKARFVAMGNILFNKSVGLVLSTGTG